MKKIGAIVLAIILVIAFVLPYIWKEEPIAEQMFDFGFKSSSTFLSVQQGKPFVFDMNAGQNIDRIELSLNGNLVKSWEAEEKKVWIEGEALTFQIPTQGYALGTYSIQLSGFSSGKLMNNDERFLFVNANNEVQEQEFELLNTHPHNPNNFTQGYEFYNNLLFESTGNPNQTNATKVARLDENTGASVMEAFQPNPVFGEGITILESKIYQISWQDQKCFVYNALDLSLIDSLRYDGEGWGLCNNDKYIFMSNGTNELTLRDPENFEILKTIKVHSDRGPVTNLNELEFFNGRIYANVWISEQRFQHDSRMNLNKIVIINPKSGAVEGVLDISELIRKSGAKNVPNGIAYRKSSNSFWLTGKYWEQSFEVRLLPKNI